MLGRALMVFSICVGSQPLAIVGGEVFVSCENLDFWILLENWEIWKH